MKSFSHRCRAFRRLVVAAAMLAGAPGVTAAPAPPAAVQVLGTYARPPSGSFELAVERCHPEARSADEVMHGCPVRVRLLEDGKVLDGAAFGHPACGEISELANDSLANVPRGASTAAPARVWTTRADRCDLRLTIRPVRLAPQETGLLVSEVTGVESVASQHWLFVGHGGRLSAVWSTEDEVLPEADVALVPAPSIAAEDAVVIQVVTGGREGDEVARRIVARRLRWDPALNGLVVTSLPQAGAPLYLAHVGPFASASAARAAALHPPANCDVSWRQVLPGALFPGLGLRGFVLGHVFATRAAAEAAAPAKDAHACPGALAPKIIEYVPKVEPVAAFSGRPFESHE